MMKKMTMVVVGLVLCLGAVQARAGWYQDFYGGVYNFGDDEYISDAGMTIGVYEDADGVAAVVNLYSQIYSPDLLTVLGPGTVNCYDGPSGYSGGPYVSGIDAWDNSTVNIYKAHVGGRVHAGNSSTINVYGGEGCDDVFASGTGTVNIYGSNFEVCTYHDDDGVEPDNSIWEPVATPRTYTSPEEWSLRGTLADGTAWTGWVHAEEGGVVNLLPAQPTALEVAIDIKPGSSPNTINLGSNGVVPVAILSSADFDAASVDTQTVTLAGANVAVRGKGSKELAAFEDIDGDGRLDLVVHVVTDNLLPGLFQDGFAILEGRTFDGNAIRGQDEIVVVPVQ